MKPEIEAKFLNVNHENVRKKLTRLGAVCEQPMRLMKRVTIDTPDMTKKGAWVRVRDEGHRITIAYKQLDGLTIDGTQEIEIEVSNFDAAIQLLAAAGLPHGSFQETKREAWQLGEAEIVLDEWPWLKPFIEIEASSEAAVRKVAQQLGFEWADAKFGDVMTAYQAQYSHLTVNDCISCLASVKFGDPLPDLLQKSE
jgi:adenylate cyclase class 2